MLRWACAVLLLGGLLSLSGGVLLSCVLLLDDTPTVDGNRCHFSGEKETNCGYCVASSCQKAVNACCAGSPCPALDDLDQCAGSRDEGRCTALRTTTTTSTRDGKLRSCVASHCNTECTSPTVLPPIGCYVNTLPGDPPGCSCGTDVGEAADLDVCSESSPVGSRCCADLGWPGEGLKCICRTLRCKQTDSGCTCSISDPGPDAYCTGTYCCADGISCTCGFEPCSESYVQVQSCSAATLPCLSNTTMVTSCAG